ncbi:MAG: ABC transporter ATP-binding protein [Pirellulaceae bacterium]|nr:ABC transporter ATP-binding protein [Pirellulaceae bacterium]
MIAQLDRVSKTYTDHSVAALQDVSLQLDAGQFVAICGPSGCGKSTLLLTLGGLLRPDQGEVRINDTEIYEMSSNERAAFRANQIGFVFQQFHLVPYLSVLENVLAAQIGLPTKNPTARKQAEDLLTQFGLTDRLLHRPGQLSTGERQRTAMARALLNQPNLILADEPTGNLDEVNAELVLDELAQFAAQGGAVLLVTHDANAAARATSQIHLSAGQVCETTPQS